jgi:hypothetical protein
MPDTAPENANVDIRSCLMFAGLLLGAVFLVVGIIVFLAVR